MLQALPERAPSLLGGGRWIGRRGRRAESTDRVGGNHRTTPPPPAGAKPRGISGRNADHPTPRGQYPAAHQSSSPKTQDRVEDRSMIRIQPSPREPGSACQTGNGQPPPKRQKSPRTTPKAQRRRRASPLPERRFFFECCSSHGLPVRKMS